MHYHKICVYEYDRLKLGFQYNGVDFTEPLLNELERFHSSNKIRYFNLIRNGIEFCEYVGVLQIGKVQIEVLPKLDRHNQDEYSWRNLLIGMLKEVGLFRVSAPTSGQLTLRSNSILELYFELFITALEYLIHTGLVKQYHQQTRNQTALKGALDFPRHLSKNLVHQERFFTTTSVYDHYHIWHDIFSQTIKLISLLSRNSELHNRIGTLQLDFPEFPQHKMTERSFSNLCYTRKTESYRKAIEIARLLLLSFHPELEKGDNPVLALMFDMNQLWESFVYHSLKKQFRKNNAPYTVQAQTSTPFWRSGAYRRTLRPDILIENGERTRRYVLDTKWKDISGCGPTPADLQQLFAYSQFFRAGKNALVYPGKNHQVLSGTYEIATKWADNISCSLINIGLENSISKWQQSIYQNITAWMEEGSQALLDSGSSPE